MYADLTVVTKSGARYGADAIHTAARHKDGKRIPVLSFICSGEMTEIPAEEVERIEVGTADSVLCMTCCE